MSDTETDVQNTDEDQTANADAVDDAGESEPTDVVDDEPQDESDAQNENQGRKGVRQRLADAEAERDGLRETLTRQRQAVWDATTAAAGVDPRLLASAGHTPDSLADADGVLRAETITAICNGVAEDFGIQRSRRPAPDPLVGRGGGNAPAAKGFGDVLKSVVQGTG